jgi:hypothetical protein
MKQGKEKRKMSENQINVNLDAHAMSMFIRVLDAVGYGEFISNADFKKMNKGTEKEKDVEHQKQLKELVKLIFKKRAEAEHELCDFLEACTGIKNIQKMRFDEYSRIESAVFGDKDFKDFFMSAQQSVVGMFSALA